MDPSENPLVQAAKPKTKAKKPPKQKTKKDKVVIKDLDGNIVGGNSQGSDDEASGN